MRRRALLASAAALPAAGTAGCLGTNTESSVDVTHHEDPGDAPTPGVPMALPSDGTLVDAWSVGEPSDGDPKPVHVAVANVAPETRECSIGLAMDGEDRIDARLALDAGDYARLVLYAPRDYVATVGRRPDRRAIEVGRDRFDCNEKAIIARVAADGTVETVPVTTDMACGTT